MVCSSWHVLHHRWHLTMTEKLWHCLGNTVFYETLKNWLPVSAELPLRGCRVSLRKRRNRSAEKPRAWFPSIQPELFHKEKAYMNEKSFWTYLARSVIKTSTNKTRHLSSVNSSEEALCQSSSLPPHLRHHLLAGH